MKNITFITILALFLSSNFLLAQDAPVSKKRDTITIGVDVMSRYVFRGTEVGGASPSIQPNLEYSYGNFSIGLWGAYATNRTLTQEADIYMTYAVNDNISFTVTDYFLPRSDGNYTYFDYGRDTTGHLFEAAVNYTGKSTFPISLLVATNFYGADAVRLNTDGTKKNIQFSTYAELGYSFKKFDAFMGFNLTTPNAKLGETGFYGNGFGVVNLGITANKSIKISKTFDLPLQFSLITNPQAEKIFFVLGFSL